MDSWIEIGGTLDVRYVLRMANVVNPTWGLRICFRVLWGLPAAPGM